MRSKAVLFVVLVAAGWFVGGWLGASTGVLVALAAAFVPTVVLRSAILAPIVLAAMTLVEADTDRDGVAVFVDLRPRSHQAGIVMLVIWLGTVAILWERDIGEVTNIDMPRPRRGTAVVLVLAVLVSVATWLVLG